MSSQSYYQSFAEWKHAYHKRDGEPWDKWAQRVAEGVDPDRLAETLYLDLARAAGVPVDQREAFSFIAAGSSERFLANDYHGCVQMLELAEVMSGKDLIWLRTGCAAVRDEMKRRGVSPP